jgi:hypothetical protein
MTHCRGAEARYRKTICEAVSDEMHLEGVAERLCRQSDSWSGVGEETRDAPDPHCLEMSKSHFDWRSVSQSVLASSPVWDSWPDVKSQVWPLQCESSCRVLFDERAGLSFGICHGPCQIYTYLHLTQFKYTYTT